MMSKTSKRPRGRPIQNPMPERIDAEPEANADVVMQMPNKVDWRYLKKNGGRGKSP